MITAKEKDYLRELAKKQLEYANLPIMKERERRWYNHNDLLGEDTGMVVMEEQTFLDEILPAPKCTNEYAKQIERQLMQNILSYELIGDDKVTPDFLEVGLEIDTDQYGIGLEKTFASDGIGYHINPIIETVEDDFCKLMHSRYIYNETATKRNIDTAGEVLGDILKIKTVNRHNYWNYSISQKVVDLMGMENMFCSMMQEGDRLHELLGFITDDMINFLRFQEANGLIYLNNQNDYMGSGSYCFNNKLNKQSTATGVVSTDTWGHINSQESVGISPELYHEFIYPYCARIAQEFGLVYYGCCEPVDGFWDSSISRYENLRKVSISAWCNEEFMSQRLANSGIIYSRKPSPNFLGIQTSFDEDAFRKYIKHTVSLTKQCRREFIFRDIYKLHNNIQKIKRAVEIVREETTS